MRTLLLPLMLGVPVVVSVCVVSGVTPRSSRTITAAQATGSVALGLPWDQLSLWAVTGGTDMGGFGVISSDDVRFVLIDGRQIGANDLLRWLYVHFTLAVALFAALGWLSRRRAAPERRVLARDHPDPAGPRGAPDRRFRSHYGRLGRQKSRSHSLSALARESRRLARANSDGESAGVFEPVLTHQLRLQGRRCRGDPMHDIRIEVDPVGEGPVTAGGTDRPRPAGCSIPC